MATGRLNEDTLLGYDEENSSTGARDGRSNGTNLKPTVSDMADTIMPAIHALQATMETVASGMQTMDIAGAALAANQSSSTQVASTSGQKRKIQDMDSEEEELDYMDDGDGNDHDDVAREVGGTSPDLVQGGDESDSDSLLDNISAKYDEEEDVGADAHGKLAAIANKTFSKPISLEVLKSKQELYPRPKNCEKVVVPKINSEIWKKMNQGPFKKRDLRFMNVQKAVTKSAYAITKVAEQLLKLEKIDSKEHMIKSCTDALFLLGHANTTISIQRRTLLKPILKSDHGLCDSTVPIINWLFGDNLSATLKEIRKASHLGRDYKFQPKKLLSPGRVERPSKRKTTIFPQEEGRPKESLIPIGKQEREVSPHLNISETFEVFINASINQAKMQISQFEGGRIRHYVEKTKALTSDKEIIQIVNGIELEFETQPFQKQIPRQQTFSEKESALIDAEIQKLLGKQVIYESQHEDGEFISPIFLRPKKDGTYRMILNLKSLNKFIKYHHFKMDSLLTVLQMLTPSCYMTSCDLRDAYYCIYVNKKFQKYLKFQWNSKLYAYRACPNGLCLLPRAFTKLLKDTFFSFFG